MSIIELPAPRSEGDVSLEQTLVLRRSCRKYKDQPLQPAQIGQLLWACQGTAGKPAGRRTAPSAGATYPLILYAVLPEGVYRYDPEHHCLALLQQADIRTALGRACLEQYWLADAGLTVVITAEYSRTCSRYGPRGQRYVLMEVGHAAENLFLQAEAMGLGAVAVGAFDDGAVSELLNLPHEHEPLLLVPVGVKG